MTPRTRLRLRYSFFVLPFSLFLLLTRSTCHAATAAFSVVEATIAEMQEAMGQGRMYVSRASSSSISIASRCTKTSSTPSSPSTRGRSTKPTRAIANARRERFRGPLHGIPVALKDNIHTTDMPTTGGALAFDGFVPPYEATLTKNLREAGAIIIAKTNMTELANWVASGMPGNYNALAGYGMNPYDPRPRPARGNDRWPSGAERRADPARASGTAANFWAANVGTETSGSILSPANQTMLVGIKPTVGRISRYGVIPITADQDTPGPMARTVADAAILLGALEGARPIPTIRRRRVCRRVPGGDYTRFLNPRGLDGRAHRHSARVLLRSTDHRRDEPRGG